MEHKSSGENLEEHFYRINYRKGVPETGNNLVDSSKKNNSKVQNKKFITILVF